MVSTVLEIAVLNRTTKENQRHENALRVKTPWNGTKTKKKEIYLNAKNPMHQRTAARQTGNSIRYIRSGK